MSGWVSEVSSASNLFTMLYARMSTVCLWVVYDLSRGLNKFRPSRSDRHASSCRDHCASASVLLRLFRAQRLGKTTGVGGRCQAHAKFKCRRCNHIYVDERAYPRDLSKQILEYTRPLVMLTQANTSYSQPKDLLHTGKCSAEMGIPETPHSILARKALSAACSTKHLISAALIPSVWDARISVSISRSIGRPFK